MLDAGKNTGLLHEWYYLLIRLRPDFTLYLVHRLAFRTSKFYIAPYGKNSQGLVNLSYNCDMKSGLSPCDQITEYKVNWFTFR